MIITFGFDNKKGYFVPLDDSPIDYNRIERLEDEEVRVPSFVTSDFFIDNYRKLTFLKRFGVELNYFKNLEQLTKVINMATMDMYYFSRIVTSKSNTPTLTTVRSQIKAWLLGGYEFDLPWSKKQYDAIVKMFGREYDGIFRSIERTFSPITSFR